ncbi:hypothetical protein [Amycolatopsis stemonae]
MTTPAFGGEVSELRSGYSPEVADALATTFALARDDVVLDSAAAPASSPGSWPPGRRGAGHGPGTGDARPGCADALTAAGYAVDSQVVAYDDRLSVEEIVGGVFSAMRPAKLPPPEERPAFTERAREALSSYGPLREQVRVRLLTSVR